MEDKMEYEGMKVYGTPERVSGEYNPDSWDLSRQDRGFLELIVAEAQEGRVEKRHASASDHADNITP